MDADAAATAEPAAAAAPQDAAVPETAAAEVAPEAASATAPETSAPPLDARATALLQIPVQVTAEVGRTRIPIRHLLQLAQGSVIELETPATEPMELLVNGRQVARGDVIVVNEHFGIRVTQIVAPENRAARRR